MYPALPAIHDIKTNREGKVANFHGLDAGRDETAA
jgi:hypothetical protein